MATQQRFSVVLRKASQPNQSFVVPPDEYEGTADSTITIRQNTDTGLAFSYGSSVTFYGTARAFILDELINSPTAFINGVLIFIYDTCCLNSDGTPYLIFEGIIKQPDIQLTIRPTDEACAVECDFADNSQTSAKITCIKEAVVFSQQYGANISNGVNEDRPPVYMSYYEEPRPNTYTRIMLAFGAYLAAMVTIIVNIATLGIINAFPNTLNNLQQDVIRPFTRKRFHKSPFLRSYFVNACKLCGLRLQSSLFAPNGLLYNVVRMDAAVQEGGKDIGEADAIFNDFNAPNIAFADLFASLRPFNIEFWIEDNDTLVVERKDYQTVLWIDFSTRDADIDRCTLKFGSEVAPAVIIYEYINDQSDKTGSEAFRRINGYATNYNPPAGSVPNLRGSKKVTFPYSTWRAVGDGLPSAFNDANTGIFSGLYNLDRGALLMQTGVCLTPKLLNYDPNTSQFDGNILDNNRLFFIENRRSGQSNGTIYPNLLSIDNPTLNAAKTQDFELTFAYNCEDLRTFAFNKYVLFPYIDGTYKEGRVETLTINFKDGTATINGKA